MKPTCKAEARWKFWRDDIRRDDDRFTPFAKKAMRRARRRSMTKEERESVTALIDHLFS